MLLGGGYYLLFKKDNKNSNNNEILVTSISFPNDTLYIKNGSSFELSNYLIVTPYGCKINSITYDNQNPAVLVINNGLIQTVSNGYDEIKVTVNGNITKSISVVVSDDVVSGFNESKTSLSFQERNISLSVSEQKDLSLLLVNGSSDITWKSSNESVVTVDNTGKVTGVSAGQTTIMATDVNGSSASINVEALNTGEVQKIELNQDGITKDASGNYELWLAIGESFVLTPTVVPQTAIDKQLTFEVSNQALLPIKVSDDKLSATIMGGRKATGEATITIKSSNNVVAVLKVIIGNTTTRNTPGRGQTPTESTKPTLPERKMRNS